MPNIKEAGKATQFRSGSKAAQAGRKGGIASGEARRAKRTFQDAARAVLDMPLENRGLDSMPSLKESEGRNMTVREAAVIALARKAIAGDFRAFETLRDTAGEKPTERVEVSQGIEQAEKEVAALIEKARQRKAAKGE